MDKIYENAAPLGRLLLGVFWIYFGYTKIGGIEGLQGYMASFGVPGILAYGVILLEIVGGLMILAGFYSRLASIALAGFSVLTAVIFHNNLGDQIQLILFAKNFALAGGLLMIVANGPGKLSINQH